MWDERAMLVGMIKWILIEKERDANEITNFIRRFENFFIDFLSLFSIAFRSFSRALHSSAVTDDVVDFYREAHTKNGSAGISS